MPGGNAAGEAWRAWASERQVARAEPDVENKNVVVFGLGLRGRRCAAVCSAVLRTPTAHLILAQ